MNLWGKKTYGLAVITLLALFMSSCKEESPIGTELEPNKNNVGVAQVEIPVLYDNVKIDSILSADLRRNNQSSSFSRILLGKVQDPNVGTTTLETYVTFEIRDGNRRLFPARDSTSTSLELRLAITDATGNLSQDQSFDIYEVFNEIEINKNYYTTEREGFLPGQEPIASFTLSELDTVDFEEGEIQEALLTLNRDLERRLFDLAADTSKTIFVSDITLRDNFKGIVIVPRDDNSAIVSLDRDLLSLTLNYYWLSDNTDEDGNVVQTDTVEEFTLLGPEKAYFNAEVDPIMPFQGLSGSGRQVVDTQDQFAYLAPPLGAYPRLNFENIKLFKDTASTENIAVNLAQLILSGIENAPTTPKPRILSIGVTNDDLTFVNSTSSVLGNESVSPLMVANESAVILSGSSPLAYTTSSAIRMELSEDGSEYVGDITSLVQQLMRQDSLKVAFSRVGESTNEIDSVYVGYNDYLLIPQSGITGGLEIDPGTDSTASTAKVTGVYPIYNTVRTVKFDGSRFKLKIYYTTID
ncbi:DUF4270 family protein [Roseivirga sp. BDSF3-8]|uniref:DUF4270 family protein n=1 Tax=Roseivirga sp. BDSF3-8 TaxID=3241598 RepID=UPI0035324C0A